MRLLLVVRLLLEGELTGMKGEARDERFLAGGVVSGDGWVPIRREGPGREFLVVFPGIVEVGDNLVDIPELRGVEVGDFRDVLGIPVVGVEDVGVLGRLDIEVRGLANLEGGVDILVVVDVPAGFTCVGE